jgi:hypothetical protein
MTSCVEVILFSFFCYVEIKHIFENIIRQFQSSYTPSPRDLSRISARQVALALALNVRVCMTLTNFFLIGLMHSMRNDVFLTRSHELERSETLRSEHVSETLRSEND